MKLFKLIVICIPIILLQYGCTYDSTVDLIDNSTVDEITYTNTVKNIIDNNCNSCHASVPVNGATNSLTTYENVKNSILTLGLLDRISRPQGSSGMMPDGGIRLPQVSIDKIVAWSQNGSPE